MKTITFLLIAPYKGMDEIFADLLFDREDVRIISYIGHDEMALEILSRLNLHEFDAIISRGGTATLLEEHTRLPVYDVGLSALDALRAIRLAQNFNKPIAIIGFKAITNTMHTICEALQWNYPIVTVKCASSVEDELLALRKQGISVVICDTMSALIAPTLSMSPVLVTTGYETIEHTLTQAIHLTQRYNMNREDFAHLAISYENNPSSCSIFNSGKELVLTSLDQNDPHRILPYLQEHKLELLAEEASEFERPLHGGILFFCAQRRMLHNEEYLYLYTRFRERPELRKIDAIRQIVSTQKHDLDFSYYNSAHPQTSTTEQIQRYGRSLSPVIISGEAGTGKDQAAYYIHCRSSYHASIFYQIDCETATDKNWTYLLTHHDSPLLHNNHTIYFRHIDQLPAPTLQRLLSLIADTNLAVRNRLLFSLVTGDKAQDTATLARKLTHTMHCLSLHLHPLRERSEDIPYLCTLYINRLNSKLGKQIIGFDSKALQAMKTFVWDSNLDQLQRIIEILMLLTTTSYISYENTMRQLSQENALWTTDEKYGLQFNLNQPLSDITFDIVRQVLKEEHGNHSKTAERLCISRSTLWRMLKK